MKAIVAVDRNWGIGYKGELLKRIPEDMKFFKQTTLGKVVVMGRTTFESLPRQEPLKGRTNIVLSRNRDFNPPGVTVLRSVEELIEALKPYEGEDVFVMGGAQIYAQLMPFCTEALVTKLEAAYTADAYFPCLDTAEGWTPVILAEAMAYEGLKYARVKYVRKVP